MIKSNLAKRMYVIIGFIIIIFAVILGKLFYIQIINKTYKKISDNNSIKQKIIYPGRGLIYDKNHKLIVCNEAVYDLIVTPMHITKNFDTLSFCSLIGITKEEFAEKLSECRKYSSRRPSVLLSQLSKEEIAIIEENIYKYEGIEIQPRTVRNYPYNVGAHVLGDVGEVSNTFLQKNPDYKLGDYVGLSGLEQTYENELKGIKGVNYILCNVHGVEMGTYNNGESNKKAVQGKDLILTLDIDLQYYGEKLMSYKRGSIVAIDPKTGGILVMVSAPAYNPNLLVGRKRAENYSILLKDKINRPLVNRALTGEYSPGSTFKMINGLFALQKGIITKNTKLFCNGPDSRPIRCTHLHETPLNIAAALRESCNPFFRIAFENSLKTNANVADGLDKWAETVKSFGLGKKFNSDIGFNKNGLVPDAKYYNKKYKNNKWHTGTVRSLSIGQGEILITPIQLANIAAVIANKGYYIEPHLVKSIISLTDDTIHPFEKSYHKTLIDKDNFDCIEQGMWQVVKHGTAKWYGQIEGINVCGKTGTVQNVGENHALYIAYAPMENPKIAIAVVVENSGYGSTFAAPIATLMMEYYLNDTVKNVILEENVLNTKLIEY